MSTGSEDISSKSKTGRGRSVYPSYLTDFTEYRIEQSYSIVRSVCPMANGFQFEDESIPTCQLEENGLDLFLNEELTGSGEVRSSNKYRYGTITSKAYSVQFHRLEEAHGSLASGKSDTDDASLIVLRITPKTDSPKRRFKNFTITLTLEPANISSNADPPSLAAFEPAADAEEYFQEHVISVTKTNTYQGNLGIKPPMAEFSISPSTSTARQFEDRRLLKLTATPYGETAGVDTEVKFEITPAVEKDGIGDRLAVALMVKRARGASFFIKAITSANVSYRFGDMTDWRPGKHHENALRIGPFGPQKTGLQTNPPGIDTANMMAAADQVLKKLAYLHLPERGTKKLFLECEAEKNATPELSIPVQIGDPAAPDPNPAAPAPIVAGIGNLPTLPETQPDKVKDAAERVSTGQPPARPQDETFEAALPPSLSPAPRPRLIPQRSTHQRLPLASQNSRAVRHRMMASLYQNLAQLHLEDAEETEALIEMAYADHPAVTEGS